MSLKLMIVDPAMNIILLPCIFPMIRVRNTSYLAKTTFFIFSGSELITRLESLYPIAESNRLGGNGKWTQSGGSIFCCKFS